MNNLAIDPLHDTMPEEKGLRTGAEFSYKSGDRPLDGYTVKRGLGWGGFGEVYYAISDGGKEVALKLVQRHLEIELRGVAQCLNLKSHHLVSIYDVRKNAKGENWIVMEYMSGDSLLARLDKADGPLPFDEAMHWLAGIASAIDDLHQAGIVHRDLKPGNVFSEGDLVKVGDYGLSKFITHSRRSGQTQSVGTVHYMAPEISTGNYGRSVDVYSTAIIAFEMLTGDVPFDGETAGEILMKHLTAEPALERVDPKFRPIFAKALAKNPLDRHSSVGQLYREIRAVGLGEPLPADTGPPPLETRQVAELQPEPARRRVTNPRLLESLPPPPGTLKAKRRAASDVLWTMFLAGVLSIVLPILAMTGQLMTTKTADISISMYVSLALLTGLSSWGILSFARFWESARVDVATRRFTMLLFGFGMGAMAVIVNAWLGQQLPSQVQTALALKGLSTEALRDSLPTLLIYLSAFGFAFAIPDWAKGACASRASRFSIWRVIWAGCIGLFLGNVFDQMSPEWLGGIMAMTAVIIQWVSPCAKSSRRLEAMEYA